MTVAGLIASLATGLAGQSAEWTSTLVVPALPSPYISQWENNPGNAMYTVTYAGTGAVPYTLEVELTEADKGVIARARSPTRATAGPTSETITGQDVWAWELQASSEAEVARALTAGVIPEGAYTLCVRVVSTDNLQLNESCAAFAIVLPTQPFLLSPGLGEQVASDVPVFQWTPVEVPPQLGPEYRLRVVEVYEQQTPSTAIRVNDPIHTDQIIQAPVLVYPADAVPLEEGKKYAWQIRAVDLSGQALAPDGLESPIWWFRRGPPSTTSTPGDDEDDDDAETAAADTITLVPGLARIVRASETFVEPTPTGYRYDGTAWLELASPFRSRMRVRMQGLETTGTGENLRVTGGRAVAEPAGSLNPSSLPPQIELDRIVFDPARGLTATARMDLGGGAAAMNGRLNVTAGGIYGTLRLDGAGDPLLALGDGPTQLVVRDAEITLPGGELQLGAELTLFGKETECRTPRSSLSGGGWSGRIACATDVAIDIGGAGRGLEVLLRSVSGALSMDVNAGTVAYDLSADARIRLSGPGGELCSIGGMLSVDGSGVDLADTRTSCLQDGGVQLGWLELDVDGVRVSGLDFTAEGLDPQLEADLTPRLPTLPDVPLPRLEDVTVSRAGIEVGSVELPTPSTTADVGGFGLKVTRILTDGFRLGWDDWSAGQAGEAAFGLVATLALPELKGAPGCIGAVGQALESVSISGGRLRAELTGGPLAQACDVDLPGAGSGAGLASLSIDELGGALVVDLSGPLIEEAPTLGAELVLGAPFACQGGRNRVPLDGLRLMPGGGLEGTVTGLSPPCPVSVAGIDLWFENAELAFEAGETPGVQLSGSGRARFAAAGQEIRGSGSLTLELPEARVTAGELRFSGSGFEFAYPSDAPLASFTIGEARLSPAGLSIDGRYTLGASSCQVPVTFDGFTVGFDAAIASGQVLFDAGAAAEATIDAGGGVTWAVSCAPLTDPLGTGARIELPAQVALGPGGLTVEGSAAARLAYEGRNLASITADFSSGFQISTDPLVVASGRVDVREQTTPLGYFDRTGFHPNFGALARYVVPDRLPLPTEQVAYLQVRAPDGSMNVEVETRGDSVRLYTPARGTAPLVMPALQLGRAAAPTLDVALDVWIDAGGGGLLDGELRAGVPASRAGDFDLSPLGVPLTLDSLIYADDGGGYAFRLAGRPVLPDGLGSTGGQVRFTVEPSGRMVGKVEVVQTGDLDLIPSGAVRLSYDTVAVDIDADLVANRVLWAVDLAGDLAVVPRSGQPYEAGASLRASDTGISFTRLEAGIPGEFAFFDAGAVRIGLGDLQVSDIAYDQATGWDFELWLDISLEVPELDAFQLPTIEDVALTPDSLTIPAFEIPDLGQVPPAELAGFELRPLAVRMDSLTFDLLGGSPPSDWGLRFDLELALGSLPANAPPDLQGLTLSVLDASLGSGGFSGTIETRVPQPGITFPIGSGGMEVQLMELGGTLSRAAQGQQIQVDAEIAWRPPDMMACGTADPSFDLTGNTLSLSGDGRVSGRINDLARLCPIEMGPLTLELTGADLAFALTGDSQSVSLDADAEARIAGSAPGDTVTAQGAVELDLLAGRIVDGSIAIADPFRWGVPAANPLFTFLVRQARLDTTGLVLTGSGDLRVGPDPSTSSPGDVNVGFNDLTMALPSFSVTSGTVTLNSSVALDAGIGPGGLSWAVRDTSTTLAEDPGLRVTLPVNATLGADGLEVGGSSGAELAFADSLYPLITADFQNQFRLGFDPVRVNRGRVDLNVSNSRLAWVDSTGFNPDNIVGTLPVPARLPLPSEDVAYLQLRDPQSDQLLVETANETGGVRVSTTTGETVDLVVPALAAGQGSTPTFQVTLDVVIEPTTRAVQAGTVHVAVADTQAAPLYDLAQMGVPMGVRSIQYADSGGGYALSLDARLQLPSSLDSVRVDLAGLGLDPQGLTGEALVGSYRQGWDPQSGPVADAVVGGLTLEVDGARAVFGQSPLFEMEGGIRMALFRDGGQQDPPARLPFTAGVTTGGLDLTADPSQLPNGKLPLGVATFEPTPIASRPAVSMRADASETAVVLRGVLRAPSLSDGLEVTLDSLTVGTGGVTAPSISLSSQSELQSLELFGAEMTLQDVGPNDAIALSIQNQVLALTMAGELDFLGRTAEFTGLRVATDGSVGMTSAALVDESITVVDSILEITRIGVENGALTTDLAVTLPAPYADVPEQTLAFSVSPDGTVSGGGNIVVLDEPVGVSNAQVQTPLVHAHMRYLDAEIDLASQQSPGAVRMVGDLYLQGESGNLITVGDRSGNSVTPGLIIGFDGSLQWGSIGISREFDFDFDVLRMTVRNAGVHQSGSDLAVEIGGAFRVDVPVISGGIDFERFRVGTDLEPDLSQFRVLQGNMTLANLFSISVNDFRFVQGPATISVTSGGLPDQANDISTEETQVDVSSYVSFGGSVGIGANCGDGNQCIFSGGVRLFQFYRTTTGDVSLVVDSAHFSMQDMAQIRADLMYAQSGDDFAIEVGAQADLLNTFGATMVGVMDNRDQDLRAGLFLAVNAVMPIVPGIFYFQSVGGGFFYNGRPEHIQMVRSYVNVPDLSSDKFEPPVGKFTGLFFADYNLITPQHARGRTLIVASDDGLQIDGIGALLTPPGVALTEAPLRGTMSLGMNYNHGYVEGNFGLVMDYSPVVEASQDVGFYVYGQDAWGIHGNGNVTLVTLVNGESEFMIGPPGFFVRTNAHTEFSFWIVDISANADASVWRLHQPSQWGAYMAVMAKAQLGPVKAQGRLRGVLIQEGVSLPYVYAGANAEGCVGKLCKRADIWAKFKEREIDFGFGSDPDLDRAVDRAQQAQDRISDEADEVAANIQESRPQPGEILISDDQLAAAWQRFQNESMAASIMQDVRDREQRFHPYYNEPAGEDQYFSWYSAILRGHGAPEIEVQNQVEPQTIQAMADRVTSGLQQIDSRQQAVYDRLTTLDLRFDDFQSEAAATWPESPVRSATFSEPQATEVVDPDGTIRKELQSTPSFEVDTTAAAQAEQEMAQREQRTDQLQAEVWNRIQQIQAGFDSLRVATTDTAGPASPLEFASLHGSVLEAAQMQYAYQGDKLMRERDWLASTIQQLETRESEVRNLIFGKTAALEQAQQFVTDPVVRNLAEARAQSLSDIMGSDSVINAYQQQAQLAQGSDDPWFAEQADSLGVRLWYDLAHVGMQDAAQTVGPRIDSVRTARQDQLQALESQHMDLTQDLNDLYREQTELAGILYDLYTRYEVWLAADTATASSPLLAGPSVSGPSDAPDMEPFGGVDRMDQTRQAKQRMATLLETPSFDRANVMSVSEGYLAREYFSWWGSHPSGEDPYEFLYDNGQGSVPVLGTLGMQSNGSVGGRAQYLLAPDTLTSEQDRTLRISLRAGAGYLQTRRIEYTTRFEGAAAPGSQPPPIGSFDMEADTTAPRNPPSIRHPGWRTDPTVWGGDSTSLGTISWSAGFDPESSMSEYRYAIARTLPTESGPGSSCQFADTVRAWTSTGGRREAQLIDLDLSPDSAYWVMVRGYNASGLSSDCGVSKPMRYDDTPPTFGGDLVVTQPADTADVGLTPPSTAELDQTAQAACTAGTGGTGIGGRLQISGAMESFEDAIDLAEPVRLEMTPPPVQDPESGVGTRYWALTEREVETFTTGDLWTEHTSTGALQIEGDPLTYADSFYVSYAAMNRAGSPSQVVTHGPFRPADPTPPIRPLICGEIGTNGRLRVTFESRGGDAETDRAGYRYRVRTAAGTVLRDWPATDDLAPDSVTAGTVLVTDSVGTSSGASYYVDVMIRNGHDMRTYTSTGPIQVDQTPPPEPVIQQATASPTSSGTRVEVYGQFPDDPESGTEALRWFLLGSTQQGIQAGSQQDSRIGVGHIQLQRTGTMRVFIDLDAQLGMQSGQTYTLVLIPVNGAGLEGRSDEATFMNP